MTGYHKNKIFRLPGCIELPAVLALAIMLLPLYSAGEDYAQERARQLGDKAYDSDMYSLAQNYYNKYLKNSNPDSIATLDAYFCLIATCLQSNNPQGARSFMDELKQKYSDNIKNDPDLQRRVDLWDAEILLGYSNFPEAAKAFSKIVSSSTSNDSIMLDAITGLGISQVRLQQFTLAEETYKKLKEAADKTSPSLQQYANEQLLLIYLMNKNFKAANEIISKDLRIYANDTDTKLLDIFSLTYQNKLDDAVLKYNEIKTRPYSQDPLWFITVYGLAQAYIQSNNYEKALPFLNQASSLAGNIYDRELVTILRINAFLKLNMLNQAIETASQFLKDFPYSTAKGKILLTLSQSMAIEKKFGDIKDLAKLYFNFNNPIDSDNSQLAILIGRTFIQLKEFTEAEKYFDYVISNSKETREIGEARLWKTEILYIAGKYDEALKNLISIENEYPYSKEAAILKEAQIYIAISNFSKASATLKKMLEIYPGSNLQPPPMFLYAASLKYLGDTENAIKIYMDFAEKFPDKEEAPAAYFEAASLAMNSNYIDQAISLFQDFINRYGKSPLVPNAMYKLIHACYIYGDVAKAKKYARELSEKYPDTLFAKQAMFWLADYYIGALQYQQAETVISDILSRFGNDPAVSAKATLINATILSKENHNEKALGVLDELLKKYPEEKIVPQCYFLEGDILSSLGKYQEAISYYTKSEGHPEEPDIQIASSGRIGDCFLAMLNYTQDKDSVINSALRYYNKVLDNNKLSELFRIQTLYKTGKCYELKNNLQEALNYYHEAFYSNLLMIQNGRNPASEWFIKSGIAMVKILQGIKTQQSDREAVEVLQILGKYNIMSKEDIDKRIEQITK